MVLTSGANLPCVLYDLYIAYKDFLLCGAARYSLTLLRIQALYYTTAIICIPTL